MQRDGPSDQTDETSLSAHTMFRNRFISKIHYFYMEKLNKSYEYTVDIHTYIATQGQGMEEFRLTTEAGPLVR